MSKDVEILIVEENLAESEHLKHILEQHEYRVSVEHNGKIALDAARANPPQIVISAIEKAQTASPLNEELLSFMLESAKDYSIFTTDADGRVTSWNAGAERFFGYPEAEILGQSAAILFTPEDREIGAPEQELSTAITEGRADDERWQLRKDETRFWMSGMVRPHRDDAGRLQGFIKIGRDLTEQKHAEDTLYRRERELSDFVENATVGMQWIGGDGIIKWANKTELDLLGYTPEEYIGHHVAEFHADQEEIDNILQRLTDDEALHDHEARMRCKDGTFKNVLINSNVFREDGEFIHTRCFTRDITERKRAQEELQKAHEELEARVKERTSELAATNQLLQDEITERERAENRLMIQHGVARILAGSLTLEEAMPKILQSLRENLEWELGELWRINKEKTALNRIKLWHAESFNGAEWEDCWQVISLAADESLPVRIWQSGEQFWVEDIAKSRYFLRKDEAAAAGFHSAFGFPIRLGNEVLGVMTFFSRKVQPIDRNVLEMMLTVGQQVGQFIERRRAEASLKESEERYRGIVELAQEGIWVLDEQTKTSYVNDRMAEMLGYTADEMLGHSMYDFMDDESRIEAEQNFQKRREGIKEQHDFRFRRKDKTDLWAVVSSSPIMNESGVFMGAVGMITDITQRKLAEKAVRESEEKYRTLFNANRDGYAYFNLEGKCMDANPAYLEMLGYSLEEIKSKDYRDITPSKWIEFENEIVENQILARGYSDEYEKEYIRKDGTIFPVSIRGWRIDNEAGNPIGMSGYACDITERKQTEREVRLRPTLVKVGFQAFFVWLMVELAQYLLMPYISSGIALGFPIILGSLTAIVVAYFVLRKQSAMHLRTLKEINARRQAENQNNRLLRQNELLLNSASEGIFGLDLGGNATFANPAAAKMVGWEIKEMISKAQHALIHHTKSDGTPYPPEECQIYAACKDGTVHHVTDEVFWRKDGTSFPVEYTSTPIRENGQLIGAVVTFSDITKRKQAEDSLRASERRFRELVEILPIAVYVCDESGGIESFNERAVELWGRTPKYKDIVDSFCGAYKIYNLNGDYLPHAECPMAQVLMTGIPIWNTEIVMERPDGSRRTAMVNIIPRLDEQANLTGAINCLVDVTERKQANDALRQSETNLAAAQQIAHLGSWELDIFDLEDSSKNPVHCSDEVYRIFGYEPGQIEVTAEVFYSFVHSRERTRIREALFEAIKQKNNLNFEVSIVLPDGRESILYVKAEVIYDEQSNKPLKLTGIVQDITKIKQADEALRESEQRYRLLGEGIWDQVWTAQPDGKLDYINNRSVEFFGRPKELLLAEGWQNVVHPDDLPNCIERWTKSLQTGENYEVQFRLLGRDGSYRWHLGRATAGRDAEGKIIKWFGTNTDINDQKLAEESLRKSEERLQQSQKMEAIGTLTGGVAHDFNNLLTAILGNTQLAQRNLPPNDPIQLRLMEVANAGNRAAELTHKLLAFSRRQHLERRTVNLNHTIVEVVKLLERIIGEDVEISVKYASDLSAVFADPTQLEQVIMNLAVNARDAMSSGGKLTIETRNVELNESYCRLYPTVTPGTYVQIRVSDSGTGMDKETQARIFEPYFTTKEVGKGTGLGLPMTYGIIKQHDGHITIYSELGLGTTFKIYLPTDKNTIEEKVQATLPSFLGGSETILVAEDEEMLRNLAKETLEDLGYTVLLAKNGEEAVEVFGANRERIDLFLSDVVMPRMGGSEAYERIREMGGNIPLIFMTGYSSETVQSRFIRPTTKAEELGAVVIQKPYVLEELGRIVREVLNKNHKP